MYKKIKANAATTVEKCTWKNVKIDGRLRSKSQILILIHIIL
jgi:hypothetical protein